MMKFVKKEYVSYISENAENLATKGLRTLVLSQKIISQEEYDRWDREYKEALTSMENRQEKIDEVVSKLENNMEFLCVTGVEDLLQDDVATTIDNLRNAGMKVWMLTGDMFSAMNLRERERRAMECLERVNLVGAEKKYPGEISGGMQKRVAIARAIALNPKYLFCDEPNSGLDPKTSLVIDDLLHSTTQEFNMTTIINTHDMNSVMGIGENIIFIYEGHKEWQGVSADIMGSTNKRLTDFIFASDLLKEMREAVTHKG